MPPTIRNNRWVREPDDFAVLLRERDLSGADDHAALEHDPQWNRYLDSVSFLNRRVRQREVDNRLV